MEKRQEYWEGLAAGFFFLAALGAMMFIVTALMDLSGAKLAGQINGWLSLASLLVAGIGSGLLMLELGNRRKFYLVFANPSSIASLGAIIQNLFLGLVFLYATFFFSFIPWAGISIIKKSVAVLGIITALGLVIYPGLELGEARGRAFWNGGAMVPLFLITGASSGLAGFIIIVSALGYALDQAVLVIDKVLIGFLFLQLISVAGYMISMSHSGAVEAKRAAALIVRGDFRSLFWLGVVAVGSVIPLGLYLFGVQPYLLMMKAFLVLVGGACFRYVFLLAAVRRSLPGEDKEWGTDEEARHLAARLEKRWQEKAKWLYERR